MKEQFKLINRALVKRIKVLPNVSEFITQSFGFDEYALLFGIKKTLRNVRVTKFDEGKFHEKYLRHQMERLTVYAANGDFARYEALSDILTRKSTIFRLMGLNQVHPYWYLMKEKPLKGLWRKLSHICANNSTELKSKRLWIDKKVGDYARPLTIPKMEWRAFTNMKLEIFERYVKARNRLSPWQHGGRSGVGVKTCWEEVYKKLDKKFIFEFDLKGFFDHISHAKIAEIFNAWSRPWGSWIQATIATKPMKFVLPPDDKDKALIAYNKICSEAFEDDWGVLMPTPENYGFIQVHDIYLDMPIDATAIEADNYITFDEVEEWDAVEASLRELKLSEEYKNLMNDGSFTRRLGNSITGEIAVKEPTLEDRALGRDDWKDLNLPGRGVPQGLGISPFLATLLTHNAFFDLGRLGHITMYMDDGLLFANSKEEMEWVLKEFRRGLE